VGPHRSVFDTLLANLFSSRPLGFFPAHGFLLGEMQVVAQPLPGVDLVDRQARLAVGQRQEEVPAVQHDGHDNSGCRPRRDHALAPETFLCVLEGAARPVGDLGLDLVGRGGHGGFVHDGLDVEDELDQGSGDEA